MPASAETYRFTVGRFACTVIQDGFGRYPASGCFANFPEERYRSLLRDRGESEAIIEAPYLCLLIDTGRERLLVDTGYGNLWPTAGRLLPLLRAEGIGPRDVNTVILSHGHPDHVGGILDAGGGPSFPDSRYVMFKREWDYWMSNPTLAELPAPEDMKEAIRTAARTRLPLVATQIDLLADETEICAGVRAVAAFGHSPGQMALDIASAGERLLFVADAFIHPLHVEYPEAAVVTDHVPDQVAPTRRRLLERAARDGAAILASHFPFPGLRRSTARERAADGATASRADLTY